MPTIELFESEIVVARGTRRTNWRVRIADGWMSVSEHPSARVERVDSGPGTVWERRIELDVETGTRLERVLSSPAPARRADPLSYLKKARPRTQWRSSRTQYRVGPRGELVTESSAGRASNAKRRGFQGSK